ncbi:hypothetical protein ACTG15_05830 [Aeromonas sp. 164P]
MNNLKCLLSAAKVGSRPVGGNAEQQGPLGIHVLAKYVVYVVNVVENGVVIKHSDRVKVISRSMIDDSYLLHLYEGMAKILGLPSSDDSSKTHTPDIPHLFLFSAMMSTRSHRMATLM